MNEILHKMIDKLIMYKRQLSIIWTNLLLLSNIDKYLFIKYNSLIENNLLTGTHLRVSLATSE